jgi:hypothetical protein
LRAGLPPVSRCLERAQRSAWRRRRLGRLVPFPQPPHQGRDFAEQGAERDEGEVLHSRSLERTVGSVLCEAARVSEFRSRPGEPPVVERVVGVCFVCGLESELVAGHRCCDKCHAAQGRCGRCWFVREIPQRPA